ncbi:adipocyte plasma membrane-associated protein-like isoform X2 [Pocillopora verrucosa]|uniref:adipocyte plasma membrane-associated protein-like isoform X1 n=1 Tax=Pocillopora verrucosa TaxID=203993 RepID=UPI0033418CFF
MGVTGMLITLVLLIFSALDVLFFFLPTANFDSRVVSVYQEESPKFEGALAVNSILTKTQKLYEGDLVGPGSIAADSEGTLYTGLADGRIVKLEGDKVVDVVRTGKQMANCGKPEAEAICGRPEGMRFNKFGSNLIVADAYQGLLEVNPKAKTVSTLVPSSPGIDGRPFRFVNDLDIAQDRTIYFTDTSSKWQRYQHDYSVLEGDNTGRLMAYYPETGKMEVLMDGLHFASGVQISPEGDYVLVVELGASRVMKYHIKGELKGKSEVFIQNLPGFPDHIRLSSKGGYWLGIATMRTDFFDLMQQYPRAKNFIAKVVSLPWLVTNTAVRYGLLLELDESGNITRSFHDPTGSVIPGYLSEVHDDGDVLFFGSFFSPFVGRLELKE